MAARGANEKEYLTIKLKKMFPDAFEDDKGVLRIPLNGLEIKVSLVCAKDVQRPTEGFPDPPQKANKIQPPTEEEVTEMFRDLIASRVAEDESLARLNNV